MKNYKSKTKNRGTTIILEDCTEAIEITDKWISENGLHKIYSEYGYESADHLVENQKERWEKCKKDLVKGNPTFKESVEKIIDDILHAVDEIEPLFSQQKQGYDRTDGESAVNASPELIMQGEEMCGFKKKHNEEMKLKKGAGEGAYRVLINTDVSWWGTPEMNCGLVAALIVLLQRYAPTEIWVQQGWLGGNEKDGITLFKLDYSVAIDLNNLSFWICHPNKDNVFSYLVNRALKRVSTATSAHAEIECDLMLRGDWLAKSKITYQKLNNANYYDRIDMIAKWIAETGYQIIYEDWDPNIQDI